MYFLRDCIWSQLYKFNLEKIPSSTLQHAFWSLYVNNFARMKIGFSFVDNLPFKIRQVWQHGWNHFLMMETLLVLVFRWTSEGCRLVHRCYQAESLFGHLVCQEGKVSHHKLVIYVSACYSLKELKLHWQDLRKFKMREEKEKYTSCVFSCVWLMGFAEAAI